MTKTLGPWALTVLSVLPMLLAGGAKLAGTMTEDFRAGGFPDGFVYLIGFIEVFGGLAFLHPRLATWMAFPLVGVMIGATGVHALHGHVGEMWIPAILGVMIGIVGWLRRDQRWRPGAAGEHGV